MTNTFHEIIAEKLNIRPIQVEKTIRLLEDKATIPFISRYRKETTGGLNEVEISSIKNELDKLYELQSRKGTVLKSIEEQGKLTDELKERINNSWNSTEIEDIYLPFKPKRQTKAEAARKKGLEPLAKILMAQREYFPERRAKEFISAEVLSPNGSTKMNPYGTVSGMYSPVQPYSPPKSSKAKRKRVANTAIISTFPDL